MKYASRDKKTLIDAVRLDTVSIARLAELLPAPSVELTTEQLSEIASQIDVSGKVDKETGKSLVSDTLIGQIHASGSDNQDISGKVDKVTGKELSANDLTDTLKGNYDGAYSHSQTTHAPSNAQKNSDITKQEIENVLTGELSSHSHAGGSTPTSWGKYF